PASYEHRGTFPSEFVWGAATAAYQVDGSWDAEDKGLSIWDVFTGTEGSPVNPGMVAAGQVRGYHRLKDDVALLQRLGLTAYRFSISWPRLLPNGTLAASGA
ncbi:glycoside hydrolase superfamily, partial [Pavlovales sp. CCMP2436]